MQLQQPSLHRIHDRRARVGILVFAPLLSVVVLWTWLRRPHSFPLPQFVVTSNDGTTPEHRVSDGADGAANGHTKDVNLTSLSTTMDDVLVVLKTGVTESLSKVPVHLETTLSAIPHFVVVSDYEEEIAGVKTQDVLRRVNDSVKRTIPEFELYNRIQELGREALTHADYGDDSNGPFGRQNNPGWRLDKWKFLPMIPAALDYKPDADWYVFMEADSYIFWPNLVSWLSLLDHTEDYYLGYPMQIGETVFAYGGSGFVISNPVMRKMAQYLDEKLHETSDIDDYTATQWAGDCVLGKVFGDAGVGLNWSWPMLQDNKPWDVDSFAVVNDHPAWCYPVVSYHHMQPDDIRDMWEFDQEWFQTQNSSLLYNDVFHRLILPKISSQHENWDNAAENLITSQDGSSVELGFDECSDVCLHDPNCLSYRVVEKDKSCFVSSAVKRGSASAGVKSNWMMDRIRAKIVAYGTTCAKVDFVL